MSTAVTAERVTRAAKRLTGTPTIGADIDSIWKLRENKRALEAQAKKVEEEIGVIEERLMSSMNAQGIEKSTGTKASVSISTSVVADVQDWDSFYAFIAKNKHWHLLQKRVSDPSYRELLDAGKKVPGVQPFSRKKLNLRALAT